MENYKSPSVRRTPQCLVLQGFVTNIDKYDRISLQFLDDYESEHCIIKPITGKNVVSFTKSYLLKKDKSIFGNSPVSSDKQYFYVKTQGIKVGYIDEIPHPIIDLKQHKVELSVEIKKYDFHKNGKQTQGWYITLKKINLLEY